MAGVWFLSLSRKTSANEDARAYGATASAPVPSRKALQNILRCKNYAPIAPIRLTFLRADKPFCCGQKVYFADSSTTRRPILYAAVPNPEVGAYAAEDGAYDVKLDRFKAYWLEKLPVKLVKG